MCLPKKQRTTEKKDWPQMWIKMDLNLLYITLMKYMQEFTVNAKLIWRDQHSSTANFHKQTEQKNSEASLSLVFLVCQYLAAAGPAVEKHKWKSKYILIIYCTKIRETSSNPQKPTKLLSTTIIEDSSKGCAEHHYFASHIQGGGSTNRDEVWKSSWSLLFPVCSFWSPSIVTC